MTRDGIVSVIVASCIGIGVVYASAFLPGGLPAWAPWLMIASISTLLVATFALGAVRNGSIGRLVFPFAAVWLVLVGGFGLALILPAETAADPRLVLGLPLRTAIVLYGVGLVPLLFVPIAYAATFSSLTLSDADLERLRAAANAIRDAEVADDSGAAEEYAEVDG